MDIQTQVLLKDMVRRYEALQASEVELKKLDRAELLLKRLRSLRLIVKRANFVRRANHLAFAQAVSEFYSSYGEVLRYLRIDQARGKLKPELGKDE
jgi:CRISPR/Cas system endoribonuclease Cas6 (RAMP superfamily)